MKRILVTFLACQVLSATVHCQSLHVPFTEDFGQRPNAGVWEEMGTVKSEDGTLVLDTSEVKTSYPTSAIMTLKAVEGATFSAAPITMEFRELTVSGEGEDGNKVFMAVLSADAPDVKETNGYVKIRLTADGNLYLIIPQANGGKDRAELTLQRFRLILPIHKLSLKLDAKGYRLEVTDARQTDVQQGVWPDSLDASQFENTPMFMILKASHRPGDGGNTLATLKSFGIAN